MKIDKITLLKSIKMLTLSAVLAVVLGSASVQAFEGQASQISPRDLLDATNSYRQTVGGKDLKLSQPLTTAAEAKLNNMFTEQYWAHSSESGKTPWYFIKNTQYQYDKAGENLAKNYYDAETALTAWMNSESHRANVLDEDFSEVGFASKSGIIDNQPALIIVAMYAKPTAPVVLGVSDGGAWFGVLNSLTILANGMAAVFKQTEQFWVVLAGLVSY